MAVAALLLYAVYAVAGGTAGRARADVRPPGGWEAAHYGVPGSTQVVVRKVADGRVVDEHVIAVVPDSDPDYDEKFLEAMARARARVALFESED
jgi:hypothetical protein